METKTAMVTKDVEQTEMEMVIKTLDVAKTEMATETETRAAEQMETEMAIMTQTKNGTKQLLVNVDLQTKDCVFARISISATFLNFLLQIVSLRLNV